MTEDRNALFETLLAELEGIIDEEALPVDAKLQAVCDTLRKEVPHYDWVGFYMVDPDAWRELVLGPFAGEPTEHTRIPFGRGICGQAAEQEEMISVGDVSEQSNYLACSINVKSEIVVPIFNRSNDLGGLIDIDSHKVRAFTEKDRRFLEDLCRRLSPLF